MRAIPLLLALLTVCAAPAQRFDDKRPPNTYRNADNPHYWRNRPPRPGYWQQDVHYVIKARLDDARDFVEGDLTLHYHNNSPDTLRHVFFHLYQEAYTTGSHLHHLAERQQPWMHRSIERADQAGTRIAMITGNGAGLRTEQDNTVLKAYLAEPIPPGGSHTFRIAFTTHWAMDLPRRMKLFNAWGQKHYDGVHWYPRIAVYDQRFGWDTQQHLGNEFYGDFGAFDVELDLPHHYVVEATGWLQNRDEVLPPDLRARLDLANFKDKPWGERPSVIIEPDPTTRKVWKYHAENTHDFAFTADPTYRIGEAEWNGVLCVALAQEPHASGWQNAANYTADIIRVFSEDFGMYAYPKMVVADARDGMEYPMLTLDSGRDPDYRGLLVHEVGHNWFYGMVGNNETYRAFLDEGFTQFLTAWGLERIDGDTLVTERPRSRYAQRYQKPQLVRESEVYHGYMRDAVRLEVPPINVHSDEFGHVEGRGGGYGHVYYKTAVMLYNLQYTLGDSLFLAAMRHYVDRWRMCHPYPEDMRQSFIDATKVDLNWFFDQWIESDRTIDYAVRGIKRRNRDAGQEIHLRRKGSMHMPIDLRVIARNGTVHDLHIPNTWFEKRTHATVLPRWIGFDELRRDHAVKVDIPSGIEQVIIDPSHRLADRYMLDNQRPAPLVSGFDHHLDQLPDRRAYEIAARPDVWWNGYDGVKVGFHANSHYLHHKHRVRFSAWINSGMGQRLPPNDPALALDSIPGNRNTGYDPLSVNLRYQNGTERLLKGSSVFLHARVLDGLQRYGAGWLWDLPNGRSELRVEALAFVRQQESDLTYLLYPEQWDLGRWNNVVELGLRHRYGYARGEGDIRLDLRSSTIGSASGYAQARVEAVNINRLGGIEVRTRGFGQFGSGNTPRESALYLAGASPEEMMENKYVRSIGFVPYDWLGYGAQLNHFHHGGGLGLRGYAGYLAPDETPDGTVLTYVGNSGVSASAEIDLDGLVRFRPGRMARYVGLDIYLFGDIGSMGYRLTGYRLLMAAPRANAGVGTALTIKRFGQLKNIKPLTVRFDMPLFLSALPVDEPGHVAFRYVVGIGRSF
jgi:aminopeptidase N